MKQADDFAVAMAEKIEFRKPSDLKRYAKNARKHSAAQVQKLAGMISRYGFNVPILIDEKTGEIIAGHGRLDAAELLQLESVPVVVLSHLSDTERRAFIIADNKIAGESEWDEAMLAEELAGLAADGFDDLAATGFSDLELGALVGDELIQVGGYWRSAPGQNEQPGETTAAATDPVDIAERSDDTPAAELPAMITSRPGDLWQLGEHRILCGDSRNVEHVARLMAGRVADLLVADPPYGMGKQSDGVANDNIYRENLDRFQMEWWTAWRSHLIANASAYVWGNAEDLWRLWFTGGLRQSEKFIECRNEIVWNKGSAPGMRSEAIHGYQTGSERCLFFMMGEQLLGNVNACDYWEGWEPIRSYLAGEVEKMKWTPRDAQAITGVQMFSHWFSKSQWCVMPENHYRKFQAAANGEAFTKPFEEIRAQYTEARKGYRAHLDAYRSYFDNTHDSMIDVWQFPRVVGEDRQGHATPKPIALMERQIFSSSAPGALIVEPLAGGAQCRPAAGERLNDQSARC